MRIGIALSSFVQVLFSKSSFAKWAAYDFNQMGVHAIRKRLEHFVFATSNLACMCVYSDALSAFFAYATVRVVARHTSRDEETVIFHS